MVDPHIHIPYDRVGQYLSFIQEKKINLELYFPSTGIDSIRTSFT
jgi:hypothetical protein